MEQTSQRNSFCINIYGPKREGMSVLVTLKNIQNVVSSSPNVRIARFLSLTSITFQDKHHGTIRYLKIYDTQNESVPTHEM